MPLMRDFLLRPESANDFQDAHDDTQKPSHYERVNEGACESENEHERDDCQSSEHRLLAAQSRSSWTRLSVGQIHMLNVRKTQSITLPLTLKCQMPTESLPIVERTLEP
jgi:hypothetical protein